MFLNAINNNDLELVKKIYEEEAENIRQPYHVLRLLFREAITLTTLEYGFLRAASNNKLEIIQFLIKSTDIDITNNNNFFLYFFAAIHDKPNIVKILLENGAKIDNIQDDILLKIGENGNLEMLKLLIEYDIDIYSNNHSLICCAAIQQHLDMIVFLLENYYNYDNNLIYVLNLCYGTNIYYDSIDQKMILLWCVNLDLVDFFENIFANEDFIFELIINDEVICPLIKKYLEDKNLTSKKYKYLLKMLECVEND